VTGFERAGTAALETIRGNLLGGLEVVARTLADGTFETVGVKGAAPPAQSGQTTLMLLAGIEKELERRSGAAVTNPRYVIDAAIEDWAAENFDPRDGFGPNECKMLARFIRDRLLERFDVVEKLKPPADTSWLAGVEAKER